MFAVLPTTDNKKMGDLISSTFEEKDIKRLPNNCYLISFQGTSAEFVNKLNLNGDPKPVQQKIDLARVFFFHL